MNENQAHAASGLGGFERTRQEVLNAGRNLWLASVGAVVEAEEAGQKLFDRLVDRGRPIDERTRKAADAFTDRANGAMNELGKLFQDTVAYESRQVLKKMGVLTRDDVKVLSARLDILARQIDEYAAARHLASDAAEEAEESITFQPEPAAARPVTRPKPRASKTIEVKS